MLTISHLRELKRLVRDETARVPNEARFWNQITNEIDHELRRACAAQHRATTRNLRKQSRRHQRGPII